MQLMTLGRNDHWALEDVGSSNVQVLAVADVSSDPQNSIGFTVLFGRAMILNIEYIRFSETGNLSLFQSTCLRAMYMGAGCGH